MSDAKSSANVMCNTGKNRQHAKYVTEDWRHEQLAFWCERAGPLIAEMLKTSEDAKRFLTHPEPSIRTVALEVLEQHWKPDAELAYACEHMAFQDTDSTVRNIALGVLASCFEGTDDKRIGGMLAAIVRDEQQTDRFRTTAYAGLFTLRGESLLWDSLFVDPPTGFPFPEEVDWSFVDTFLDESRDPSSVDPDRMAVSHLSDAHFSALQLYRQALSALASHEFEDCIRYSTDALGLLPCAAGAYLARGRANTELGRLDDAIVDLSRAVDLSPSSDSTLLARAQVYRLKGAVELAEQDERAAKDLRTH